MSSLNYGGGPAAERERLSVKKVLSEDGWKAGRL
jgi:hypothetical protein